jgi:hypothetical protein
MGCFHVPIILPGWAESGMPSAAADRHGRSARAVCGSCSRATRPGRAAGPVTWRSSCSACTNATAVASHRAGSAAASTGSRWTGRSSCSASRAAEARWSRGPCDEPGRRVDVRRRRSLDRTDGIGIVRNRMRRQLPRALWRTRTGTTSRTRSRGPRSSSAPMRFSATTGARLSTRHRRTSAASSASCASTSPRAHGPHPAARGATRTERARGQIRKKPPSFRVELPYEQRRELATEHWDNAYRTALEDAARDRAVRDEVERGEHGVSPRRCRGGSRWSGSGGRASRRGGAR